MDTSHHLFLGPLDPINRVAIYKRTFGREDKTERKTTGNVCLKGRLSPAECVLVESRKLLDEVADAQVCRAQKPLCAQIEMYMVFVRKSGAICIEFVKEHP